MSKRIGVETYSSVSHFILHSDFDQMSLLHAAFNTFHCQIKSSIKKYCRGTLYFIVWRQIESQTTQLRKQIWVIITLSKNFPF